MGGNGRVKPNNLQVYGGERGTGKEEGRRILKELFIALEVHVRTVITEINAVFYQCELCKSFCDALL